MLQLNVNLPELRDFAKALPEFKGNLFSLVRLDIKQAATEFVNDLLQCEFDLFIGREKYQRDSVEIKGRNLRNGFYQRKFSVKGLGKLIIKVPRDRSGKFKTSALAPYKRMEAALEEDMAVLFLMGLSTRSLSLISPRLFGSSVSHDKISECASRLSESVEKWRTRLISETFKYLYLDGTNFRMRIGNTVEVVTVLVVIGVTESGQKQVIALQAGDKESAPCWRQLFKDLKKRALDSSKIQLGIMDGLPGLETVFKEEFPFAKIQRCQVHVARNVLSKCPAKIKKEVADEMRSVFYASSKKKALEFFEKMKTKRQSEIPSAIKCLEHSLEQTLCYLSFPGDEWKSLRTTNPIERLNKEFKRRTKSMEIVAGEKSCYNLLAVICLRMEQRWKSYPITLKGSLPWLNSEEFTQEI
ncbi:IS256 family transposase [bacterium]|nr:IS256 family transposase [bacterium]